MNASTYDTIRVDRDETRGLVTVTLARPEVRNAFNDVVIRELRAAFDRLAQDSGVRLVLLRGDGPAFCAGADLNWMKASVDLTEAENRADARRMAEMFEAVADCPAPVLAVVHGHALGGGAGLVAAADVAIVNREAKLGFTEVKLGIIPAVISPFVVRKVHPTHVARYFTSGEVFDGAEAERIGLAQKSCAAEDLDGEVRRYVGAVLGSGPNAVREAKKLARDVTGVAPADAVDMTSERIARLRGGPEGQHGMECFLGKRKPDWIREAPEA